MPGRTHVLISAHRCGFREGAGYDNSVAGVRYAASIGADYAEFDVRRCSDGVFVCRHDSTITLPTGEAVPVDELSSSELMAHEPQVELLADLAKAASEARVGAHVDLKFVTPDDVLVTGESWEVAAAEVCATRLDPARTAFTTNRETGVVALRHWADEHGHQCLIGLTFGQSTAGLGLLNAVRARLRELFPARSFRASGATLLVAHHALATVRLSRWARRHGIPVLVWTVDGRWLTGRMLRDPRVWMITTNWPARAVAVRGGPDPAYGSGLQI
jgi:glycerophosphoryl diester phosphodiesterase